jgi:hypothetical protein
MMAKWNDKSTHRTFALYLPAILIGSAIGELMGQVALVGSAEMALIIPHLSQTQYWFAIGVIGTTAAMSMLWGRVLDIVQADANKQKRSRQRWRRLLR